MISFEPDAWIAPIKKAMAAGVLVVTSNNDSPNSGRELYFGQDLVGAAVVQGQLLAKLAGNKGKVAMTNCAPGSLALDLRIKGAREGVTKGGMSDVGVYNTNPADMASELGTMRDILRAHPDLAAMMPLCGPDTAAAGLVRKNQGLKLPIVGTDLLYQTLELIRDGFIDGTVGQQPYLQGYLPIMYAYQRVVLGAPKLELPGRQLLPRQRDRHEGKCRPVPRARGTLPRMSDAQRRPLLEAAGISKRFGSVRALERRLAQRRCRRGARASRRQRGRQIHTDRHPVGRHQARQRSAARGRQGSAARLAFGGAGRRPSRGASGTDAVSRPDGRGERVRQRPAVGRISLDQRQVLAAIGSKRRWGASALSSI